KRSEWELMRWRVRSMGAWSRAGHRDATDALVGLCTTKLQFGWFPGYVQMHLAATASPEVLGGVKALLPKADRATPARGLEQTLYGDALLAFTQPYLGDQTLCYVSTRKAGREVLPDLLARAGRGEFAAIDALGVVGGPDAVAALRVYLMRDGADAGTLAFRSAK